MAHPATIRLARGTRFESANPSGFPENYFNFFPYEALKHRVDETFLLAGNRSTLYFKFHYLIQPYTKCVSSQITLEGLTQ